MTILYSEADIRNMPVSQLVHALVDAGLHPGGGTIECDAVTGTWTYFDEECSDWSTWNPCEDMGDAWPLTTTMEEDAHAWYIQTMLNGERKSYVLLACAHGYSSRMSTYEVILPTGRIPEAICRARLMCWHGELRHSQRGSATWHPRLTPGAHVSQLALAQNICGS